MELIKNFGIEPILLASQIVNFLIIFYLLKRYAYKPILEILRNREKTIKEGLLQAEQARVLLLQTEEKEKKILKQAQQQVKELIDQAKKQHQEMVQQTQLDAQKQTDALIKEGREQIISEAKETEKRLSIHVTKLAVEMLEKSLKNMFSEKEQQQVVKQAIAKMKKK